MPQVRRPLDPATAETLSNQGLTTHLARERLAVEGTNALPDRWQYGVRAMRIDVIREPMFLLLTLTAANLSGTGRSA
ncbi:MAG TPA: cation-transporting P-type ATPase [Thiobacillus sp.]|nr:MAG: hypothetical protein B7Y50_10790 [Hydrogenophilales bacterium 28-61-11]OYZ58419.1 MAG: hypothetical protein B7Y21_03265 [Hydrogenophilales bacterium 16-61-112]OZA45913.1 MAG: hypothetical protein B7X81_07695 [Hydrogenophilales bacterium 17-61-76]HQT29686.1 cation-transporting P-type ATPase [Thiobacillus sp.]HQT70178.1 cation-transporting P-type ATPase [Thiobacillus sp.]